MSTNSNGMMIASVQNRFSGGAMSPKRRQLTKYLVSAGLGVIAGGLGVTIVMGCIVCIQLFYVTSHMFLPDARMIAIAAALVGAGMAWLLYRAVRHFSPFILLRTLHQEELRIILIFSILASLLEVFLYMQNMFTGIATNLTYAWV